MTQQTNAQRQALNRWRKNVAYEAVKAAAAEMGTTITSRNQGEFDALLEALSKGEKKLIVQ